MPAAVAAPDQSFPLAHTCFFSIQLPPYSSDDILRHKLLYAMYNCGSMDADVGNAQHKSRAEQTRPEQTRPEQSRARNRIIHGCTSKTI